MDEIYKYREDKIHKTIPKYNNNITNTIRKTFYWSSS